MLDPGVARADLKVAIPKSESRRDLSGIPGRVAEGLRRLHLRQTLSEDVDPWVLWAHAH